MIFNYGFSIVGKSHINKGTCCQDSHMIKELDNGWIVAAVADGVGSAKNSQIGSSIAAKTVIEFCAECMPWDYSVIGIKSMLRTAYNYAFKQIINESEKSGEPLESYDTTLTTVIYDGHRIIYGHSGDGAIIGLTIYGDYVQITKPQKGVDMISVLPLRSGYTVWSIDSYDEELAAVMIMTDGMLDGTLCPYLLKLSNKSEVYTPIATFFSDPVGFTDNKKESENIKKIIEDFITAEEEYKSEGFYSRLESIYKKKFKEDAFDIIAGLKDKNYPCTFMQSVQDDKTMVALINTDNPVDIKEIDFYSEPNWDKLQEKWNRRAYPHLYTEEQTKEKNATEDEPKDSAVMDDKQEIPVSKTDNKAKIALEESKNNQLQEPNNKKTGSIDSATQPSGQQYQGKQKELIDAKGKLPNNINRKNNNKNQQVYYFPPVSPVTHAPKSSFDQSPQKHEKPKKENFLSRAADAIVDFFGFEND